MKFFMRILDTIGKRCRSDVKYFSVVFLEDRFHSK